MKQINVGHEIDDFVILKELDVRCRIVSIWIKKGNVISYELRYFFNGEAKTVYVYGDDIIDEK